MRTEPRKPILDEFIPVRLSPTKTYMYSFIDNYGRGAMYTVNNISELECIARNLEPDINAVTQISVLEWAEKFCIKGDKRWDYMKDHIEQLCHDEFVRVKLTGRLINSGG